MNSFEKELVRLTPVLLRFARSLDYPNAEDLVQETMVSALSHQCQFVVGTSMSAWLHTILRNHFLDERRSVRYKCRQSTSNQIDAEEILSMAQPATQFESVAISEMLRLMEHLKDQHRKVFTLIVLEGFEYEEVAQLLGIDRGTVSSRLHRAKNRLMRLANEEN